MRRVILLIALLLATPVLAQAPAWQVCFTPGQDCTGLIVSEIAGAKREILVQAYQLTSTAILRALRDAHARGVDVEAILDRTMARKRYGTAEYLRLAGMPVWIDSEVAIAHNKLMIIDGIMVITGSFNLTKAAQDRNAENLLVLEDPALAAKYRANWERRRAASARYASVLPEGPAVQE